tara:strand:- start:844 stop:1122 length:279 start_codon:yes stop_codon:yes gene_type:complete
MLKIEKNIPLTRKKVTANTRLVDKMEIGDCIYIDEDNFGKLKFPALPQGVENIKKLVEKKAKKLNCKCSIRQIKNENNNVSGFRVWLLNKDA